RRRPSRGKAEGGDRRRGGAAGTARRQGGDRQRETRVSELQTDLCRTALGSRALKGCAAAARALGEHGKQESAVQRRALRRRAERLKAWDAEGGTRRLFSGDASLWTGTDEASWLGWLGVVDQQIESEPRLLDLQQEVRKEGFAYAVLLGMGGSSLCPEVWKETF